MYEDTLEEELERFTLERIALKNKPRHPAEMPLANSSVGLLSLPPELIDRIIDCLNDANYDVLNFEFDRRQNFTIFEDEPGIRTIYKLRLVCKQLCDRASRVFMPVVRIRLSESSLARAEEIIRHPRIPQSLQGIELILDYRSKSLASSFELFFRAKLSEVWCLGAQWYRTKEEVVRGEYENWTPEALNEEANRIFNTEINGIPIADDPDWDFYYPLTCHNVLAFERWQTIEAAWNEEQNNTEEVYPRDDPKRELLREGFRRFQAIHQVQHQLITSGEFTSRISAISAKLPSLRFLIFSDQELAEKGFEEEWVDVKSRAMFDDERMLELLSGPAMWSHVVPDATAAFASAHAIASTLIWDIPTTLYRAGVRLYGLNVRGFPLPGNYDVGSTGDVSPTDADCDNAITRLKTFYNSTQGKAPTILRQNTVCQSASESETSNSSTTSLDT